MTISGGRPARPASRRKIWLASSLGSPEQFDACRGQSLGEIGRLEMRGGDDEGALAGEHRRHGQSLRVARRRQRQAQHEGRSSFRRRCEPQAAAHLLGEAARNRKAEAGAAGLRLRVIAGDREFFEDRVAMGRGNSWPGIDDGEFHRVVDGGNAQADAALSRVFDGIADEIDQNLPQPRCVADDARGKAGRDGTRNFEPCALRLRRQQLDDRLRRG